MQSITKVSALFEQKKINIQELTIKASCIPGFLAAQRFIYAANADIKLIDNIGKTSSNFLKDVSNVYCKSVVWLLFAIELFVFLFSKDEKKIALAKKCAVGCFIFYIVLKLIGVDGGIIGTSADKLTEWMNQ